MSNKKFLLQVIAGAVVAGGAVVLWMMPRDATYFKDLQNREWLYAPKGERVSVLGTYIGGDDKWWLIVPGDGGVASQGFSTFEAMRAAASAMPYWTKK